MARKYFYPNKVSEQGPWHMNYAEQIVVHGVDIGLVLADVIASANDSKHLAYSIGGWWDSAKNFGKGAMGQMEVLKYGTGVTPFTLPEFLPPDPPAGLTPVLPGALARIFKFVKMIKSAPGYTEGIGLLLGVVGEELPPPPPGVTTPPRISLATLQTPTMQQVLVKFFKDRHEGVWLESRRGTEDWKFLNIAVNSPYTDSRELLVPGVAEVREYRAMFWDKGVPSGVWCDVARVTVSP